MKIKKGERNHPSNTVLIAAETIVWFQHPRSQGAREREFQGDASQTSQGVGGSRFNGEFSVIFPPSFYGKRPNLGQGDEVKCC